VPGALRAGHYLGLRHPAGLPSNLGSRLAQAGVFASIRGPSLRITPHLYNDAADIARLAAALGAIVNAA
jgi:selenocysteine lyase/cysteine desulfurase